MFNGYRISKPVFGFTEFVLSNVTFLTPSLFQGLITQLYHLPGIALKSLLGQFNANNFISQQGIQKQPRSIIHPTAMLTKKLLYDDSHDCLILTLHQIIHMLIYFHLVYLYVLASGYGQRDN